MKSQNYAFFYSKRAHSNSETEVYAQKTENRPTYGDFGTDVPGPPTSPNFKTHKRIVLHGLTHIPGNVYI